MFLPVSVSQITGLLKNHTDQIFTNFFGVVGHNPINGLDFE